MHGELESIEWHQMTALSWRVLSELSRTDPALYVGAITDDGSGASPLTHIFMLERGEVKFQARRGGIGFVGPGDMISWEQAQQMESARSIASSLLRMPYSSAEKLPPTRPRALGYRLIASMLELSLCDKERWWVRWETERSEWPLGQDAVYPYENSCWSLMRGHRVIAEFDNFGRVKKSQGGIVNLMPRYVAHNRRILPLITEFFCDSLK